MNEPASVSEPTKTVPDDVLQNDHGYIRQHCEVHQLYGLSMAQASYEGQITARPETRPFTITRSAWAGVQRYAMVWTGDNEALWSNMHYDIGLNLAMGLCGISFVGCDIGGFGHNPTSELYGRWFEWGVLQPFCRGHAAHGSIDQEPWAFTPEVEANVKRLLELRMSLLPFLYTCFVHSAESGDPINRPLVYEYPRDPNTHFVGDSFLLGSDILVAPVLEPGMDRRMVYLPEGEWWNWWTGEKLAGARHILAEAPFGQPPLFVRAGAIIPMQESMEYTGQRAVEETILDVWPGATLAGQLVEDDGASRSWQNGEEVRFEFSGSVESGALILRIGSPQGPYRSQRKTWRIRLHGLASKVRRVAVAQKDVETKTVDGVVEWTIPDTGNSIEMNVQLAD